MTSVDIYMQIIGQYRPISYEEEQSYAERIQSGDDEAFKDFVVRNIRLVVKIAIAQRKDTGLDLDSLVSAGNIGLMTAARKFKPGLKNRFSSYAKWFINDAMHEEVYKISKPVSYPQSYMADEKFKESGSPFRNSVFYSKDNTEDERGMAVIRSLPDENLTLPDEACRMADDRRTLMAMVERLSPSEKDIVTRRFGLGGEEPKLFREMGNGNQSTNSAIFIRGVKKMREMLRCISVNRC